MDTLRVVTGTGTGPTATAAYDAALLDAGVGNYNVVTVSSVVPPSAAVEVLDTAPDLGETGNRITVVQARAVGRAAAAALSWGRTATGEGLFYEGSATPDGDDTAAAAPLREHALREADRGLTAGLDRRDWTATERDSVTAAVTAPSVSSGPATGSADAPDEGDESPPLAAAVALAIYGESSSPF